MPTRLMVLGLLADRPLSGYEIQQVMQVSQVDRWAGILTGSIYHALKKMEKEGLVTVASVEQTGHRAKASYALTEQGREQLLRLIGETLAGAPVAYPSELYAAMSFLHLLPKPDILAAIDRQIRQVEQSLSDMQAGEAAKAEAMELPAHVRLIFENIYDQHALQLQFLGRLKQLIEQEGIPETPGGQDRP